MIKTEVTKFHARKLRVHQILKFKGMEFASNELVVTNDNGNNNFDAELLLVIKAVHKIVNGNWFGTPEMIDGTEVKGLIKVNRCNMTFEYDKDGRYRRRFLLKIGFNHDRELVFEDVDVDCTDIDGLLNLFNEILLFIQQHIVFA